MGCDADWRHIWDEQCVNFIVSHVKLSNGWRRKSCEAGLAKDRSRNTREALFNHTHTLSLSLSRIPPILWHITSKMMMNDWCWLIWKVWCSKVAPRCGPGWIIFAVTSSPGGENFFFSDFASLLKAPITIASPLAETPFFLSKHLKSILLMALQNSLWVISDFFCYQLPLPPPQFFGIEAAGCCATVDCVSNPHPCKPDMKTSSQKKSSRAAVDPLQTGTWHHRHGELGAAEFPLRIYNMCTKTQS